MSGKGAGWLEIHWIRRRDDIYLLLEYLHPDQDGSLDIGLEREGPIEISPLPKTGGTRFLAIEGLCCNGFCPRGHGGRRGSRDEGDFRGAFSLIRHLGGRTGKRAGLYLIPSGNPVHPKRTGTKSSRQSPAGHQRSFDLFAHSSTHGILMLRPGRSPKTQD